MSLIFKTMTRSSTVETFLESVWLVKTHKERNPNLALSSLIQPGSTRYHEVEMLVVLA